MHKIGNHEVTACHSKSEFNEDKAKVLNSMKGGKNLPLPPLSAWLLGTNIGHNRINSLFKLDNANVETNLKSTLLNLLTVA